jgi:hypothetical protein
MTLGDTTTNLNVCPSVSTKDESCLNFLSRSLEHCLTHHKHCTLGQDDWTPTRLLELTGNSNDSSCIRLIEPRTTIETKTIYITLSHVWGTASPLRLTRANYEEFKTCIRLSNLPQCFQDAIYVTRR